jgi:periplasmic protein TonB
MAPQLTAKRIQRDANSTAPAVVLRFPTGGKVAPVLLSVPSGTGPSGAMPASPECGERPSTHHSGFREWLRITLIASLLAHLAAYAAFQISFDNDLERAAGAAASAASDGTVTIPVEVIAEAMLPSAPSPTNANDAERKPTEPTSADVAKLMPPPPLPAPVVLPHAKVDLPPPPLPAPVVLPTQQEALELALPEEETAKPTEAKAAAVPESPKVENPDETPPMPRPRRTPPERQEKREEVREPERKPSPQKSAPSRAASPNRAASSDSAGRGGAGGAAEAGGQAAISSYFARVQAHLSRQVYPAEARAGGVSGIVRVVFALGRDGRVLSVSLAQGSGKSVLDQAALAIVRGAAPFPPFPSEIMESRLELGAPIRFDLR